MVTAPRPRPSPADAQEDAGVGPATVIVSNRGALSFHFDDDGQPVPGVAAGGLAGSLHSLVAGSGATWVASALSDADRAAARAGLMSEEGLRIELIEADPEVYRMAYDVVSNATLWFCHHHLFDGARTPRSDQRWFQAWDGYRAFNQLFAERVAEVAPDGARVLVQDYHLCLLGADLAERRPDVRTVHFSHTPFADPAVLAMLPSSVTTELLAGLAGFGDRGFHAERWAASYRACHAALGPAPDEVPSTFVSALSTDAARLEQEAASPKVAVRLEQLEAEIGGSGRRVVVRVDRMELSKNLLRGFWAFDQLLENKPQWRERVVFLALAYPSRQGLAEYLAYQREVEATVAEVNERWGTADWTPIVLHVEDDFPRSLAALSRYDVLLVNPVRDGMNLVAKEGPLVNRNDGVLVLSREAGAFPELAPAAVEVNPFDVSGTADALDRALTMEPDERSAMAKSLRELVVARTPADWLGDQIRAADRL